MTWLSSQTARILLGLLAVAYLFTPVYSLATIPKSKCIKNCGTTPKTTADDLVCPDSAYNNTEKGRTVKDCLLCQSTGTAYINDERNDIYTFLGGHITLSASFEEPLNIIILTYDFHGQ